MIDYARQFVADNLGLLLVLASQMFFSIMNVVVKQLHSIDTPISTFQVSAREKLWCLGVESLNQVIIARMVCRGSVFLASVVRTDRSCALGDHVYLFPSLHVSTFLLCACVLLVGGLTILLDLPRESKIQYWDQRKFVRF